MSLQLLYNLVLISLILSLGACKNNDDSSLDKPNSKQENEIIYEGLRISLLSKAGEQFENSNYLAFPLNHGIVTNEENDTLDVIILGKPIYDSITFALPLAYFELKEDGKTRSFILSYPENEDLQSMKIETYSAFMRHNYPIKVIIDTWFANYKGLAKIRVTNWKDNFYAENLLRENKYWKN